MATGIVKGDAYFAPLCTLSGYYIGRLHGASIADPGRDIRVAGCRGDHMTQSSTRLAMMTGAVIYTTLAGSAAAQAPSQQQSTESIKSVDSIETTETATSWEPITQANPLPGDVLEREDLDAVGEAAIGDVLQKRLIWQSNAINTQVNNGGNGTIRLNMRGLGVNRTLVLLNGQRFVAGGNGANSAVDLSAIPSIIIERVEVLPDASGAVLGPIGIGGTVNLLTRSDVDGVGAAAAAYGTDDFDGMIYQVQAMGGHRSGRGSVLVAGEYTRQESLLADERDFSRYDYRYDWDDGEEIKVGSTATPNGTIIIRSDDPGNAEWDRLLETCPSSACYFDREASVWRDFNTAGVDDPTLPPEERGDYYNYQAENYLITPSERYSAFMSGDYKLTGRTRAFFEALYSHRQSEQQLAAEPLFTSSEGVAISADNAYNPFGRDILDLRRRLVEFGNRRFRQEVDTVRVIAGIDGTIDDDAPLLGNWRWRLAANFGRTSSEETSEGRLNRVRLLEAIGPSYYDADGIARCGSADAPGDPRCVPLNLFGGYDANQPTITADMINWLAITPKATGENEQRVIEAHAGGQVLPLPVGGHIRMQLGAAHRRESGSVTPDPLTQAGDTTGNRELPTEGDFAVTSGHATVAVTPFSLQASGQELELSANLGAFHYHNDIGRQLSNQLAARLHLGGGLSLFGGRAQSFREPGISELYGPQSDSFPSVSDPCDTSDGQLPSALAERCMATGAPADHVDSRTQLKAIVGGNPNVMPENARTWTAGVNFRPDGAPGLHLGGRFFNTEISDTVASESAASILRNCYDRGIQSYCDLVTRDDNGFINEIDGRLSNAGIVRTSGIDAGASLEVPTAARGKILLDINATYLLKYNEITPDDTLFRGAGNYDIGHYPKWRGYASGQWHVDAYRAGFNVRYTGGLKECIDNDCNTELERELFEPEFDMRRARDIGDHITADLWATMTLGMKPGNLALTVGVNNIADIDPPRVYNGFTATSEPTAYDFSGRQFYLRLQLDH